MPRSRKTLIENLYKREIESFNYEVYIGSTGQEHVRTWATLNDDFNTKIKVDELGIYSESLIEALKKEGYKPIKEESKLQLKKVA